MIIHKYKQDSDPICNLTEEKKADYLYLNILLKNNSNIYIFFIRTISSCYNEFRTFFFGGFFFWLYRAISVFRLLRQVILAYCSRVPLISTERFFFFYVMRIHTQQSARSYDLTYKVASLSFHFFKFIFSRCTLAECPCNNRTVANIKKKRKRKKMMLKLSDIKAVCYPTATYRKRKLCSLHVECVLSTNVHNFIYVTLRYFLYLCYSVDFYITVNMET